MTGRERDPGQKQPQCAEVFGTTPATPRDHESNETRAHGSHRWHQSEPQGGTDGGLRERVLIFAVRGDHRPATRLRRVSLTDNELAGPDPGCPSQAGGIDRLYIAAWRLQRQAGQGRLTEAVPDAAETGHEGDHRQADCQRSR